MESSTTHDFEAFDLKAVNLSEIIGLLQDHVDDLTEDWARRVRQLPNSHYSNVSSDDLQQWMKGGILSIIAALKSGSPDAVETFFSQVSLNRLDQGYDVEEVLHSLLQAREAFFAILLKAYKDQPDTLREAVIALDMCLDFAIGRFGKRYAEDQNRLIQEQRQRADWMLQAVRTANSSLGLEQVLVQVAEKISAAVGIPYCIIYLVNPELNVLEPVAVSHLIMGTRLARYKEYPLNPETMPIARKIMKEKRMVVTPNVQQELNLVGTSPEVLPVCSLLAAPFLVGNKMLGAAVVCTLDEPYDFTNEDIALMHGITDTTALVLENAQLYQESRRRLAESQSLQRITSALLQRFDLPGLLKIICSETQYLTDAEGSTIFMLEDGEYLKTAYSTGIASSSQDRISISAARIGETVLMNSPFIWNDCSEENLPENGDGKVRSLLAAPLRGSDGIIGVLEAVNKPGGFTHEDRRILNLFADQAALSIEDARLHEQVGRLAVIEERQRLARELHDSVTQELYGVTLYAEATARLLSAGNIQEATNYLNEICVSAQGALREMRLLIFELRPPILEKEGLAVALQSRLEAVEGRAGLETRFHCEGEQRFSAQIEEDVYRIAQEALNNILKHSNAHCITLNLELKEDHLSLEVIDDGVGFDLQKIEGGMGLTNMRERATQLGGQLYVQSKPGNGTTIRFELSTLAAHKSIQK